MGPDKGWRRSGRHAEGRRRTRKDAEGASAVVSECNTKVYRSEGRRGVRRRGTRMAWRVAMQSELWSQEQRAPRANRS